MFAASVNFILRSSHLHNITALALIGEVDLDIRELFLHFSDLISLSSNEKSMETAINVDNLLFLIL